MQELLGERVLMRVHIGETDEYRGSSLYKQIVELLRKRGLAGATVFRGAASFGATGAMHSDRIEALSLNLPVIIECVDSEDRIQSLLPDLDPMIGGGLITMERAEVILYRAHENGGAPEGEPRT